MNVAMSLPDVHFSFLIGRNGLNQIKASWATLYIRCGSSFVHHPKWYQALFDSRSALASDVNDPSRVPIESQDSDVFFLAIWHTSEMRPVNQSPALAQKKRKINIKVGSPEDDSALLVAVLPFQLCQQRLFGTTVNYLQLAYNHELAWCDITSAIDLKPYRATIERAIKEKFPQITLLRWQDLSESSHAFQSGWLTNEPRSWVGLNRFRRKNSERCSLVVDKVLSRKKHIKNICRQKRNFEKMGKISFSQEITLPHNAEVLFEIFSEVEHKNWKGEEKSSLKSVPERWSFYKSITQCFSGDVSNENCNLYFLFLKWQEQVVAAQMAIKNEKGLYLLKIGYDAAFGKFGPGNLLLVEVLHQLQSDGYNHLSFVTGREWMSRWHPDKEDVYMCYQVSNVYGTRDLIGFLFGCTYLLAQRLKYIFNFIKLKVC